jgi:biotin-(acetyl-CoA carboxylase) ligase
VHILDALAQSNSESIEAIRSRYNRDLYMLNRKVRLRKQNMVFQTVIKGVSEQGRLETFDTIAREFNTGEIEWLL